MTHAGGLFGQSIALSLGETTFRDSELVAVGSPAACTGGFRVEVLLLSGATAMEFPSEVGARIFVAVLQGMQDAYADDLGSGVDL